MCQAIPKKVTKVSKKSVEVEGGQVVNATTDDLIVGDCILVYGNIALKKITKNEAREIKVELNTH